ncbi:MAG: nuclear transport factor 2 family protein [Kangiellaceae bacterium]|nr:nuclear transport factor 2 family protein [Kangiellaceae bacterium]MCW8999184.1 nuclear transport factor 2 family protein [Kangiellaceae bacterium]MCW9016932.1 nuclear transport factor 2 family protein [Kangiellaceae bacterium]
MKKTIFLLILFLQIPDQVSANCNRLDDLGWLLGDWLKQTKNGAIVESWRKRGGSGVSGIEMSSIETSGIEFSGIGYSLDHDNKKVINEELRIVEMGGEVFLIAKPDQNPVPVAFKLVACNKSEVKFENKLHDFPQNLEYRREGSKLKIKVSGEKQPGFSLELLKQPSTKVTNLDRLSLVEEYIEAFNARDIQQMLSRVTDDIHWMSIMETKAAVETSTKQALAVALKDYFVQVPSVKTKWIKTNTFGSWAFGVEQVTWLSSKSASGQSGDQNGMQMKIQCSLSVYQFEGQLIKSVWYYPAQKC